MILLQGLFSFCQGQGKVPEFWYFPMSKLWSMIQYCFTSVTSSLFCKGSQSVLYGNCLIYAVPGNVQVICPLSCSTSSGVCLWPCDSGNGTLRRYYVGCAWELLEKSVCRDPLADENFSTAERLEHCRSTGLCWS